MPLYIKHDPMSTHPNQKVLLFILSCVIYFNPPLLSQNDIQGGKPAARLAYIRESDVLFSKRIWREIDLKQKINLPLYYPAKPSQGKKSLFDVLKDALMDNSLDAYYVGDLGDDDMFTRKLSLGEIRDILIDTVMVPTENLETGDMIMTSQPKPIKSENILRYELKEDWFFDKQRSVMDVRILGICPKVAEYDEQGEFKGYKKLFWIYFPDARPVLSNARAENVRNDAERRTFDELFLKRIFSGYIIKESNVYDRYISEYKTGLDALLEAEKINEDIFNFEQDVWMY